MILWKRYPDGEWAHPELKNYVLELTVKQVELETFLLHLEL